MQITYVVDTSTEEDKSYLEFWYKEAVYKISHNNYLYMVQNFGLKDWEQENIDVGCPRVQIHSNKRVHKS